MVVSAHAGRLLGRQRERAVLERLLDTARNARGAVLVVHGDPGVGKTALLEYAVEAGKDFRVVRTAGVEGEMELDYAALQQLCSPILEFTERLTDLQRDALGVAFGLSAGQAPSPFLVGLAVLGLLSEAAERGSRCCAWSTTQRLDGGSARALAFVARRLLAERIALAFATRDVGTGLARFPELRVDPLGRRDARVLLESALAARLDESVLDRIVAETGGNPLALLELPRGLTPAQLAGGFDCRRRCLCPLGSSRASRGGWRGPAGHAAVAAPGCGRTGRRPWASVACSAAAWDPETAARAVQAEGLLTLDAAVVFRHPLVRSAVYGAPSRTSGARLTARWRTQPIRSSTRIAARGTARRRPCRTKSWPANSSARRVGRRRGRARRCRGFPEGAVTLTREPSRRARRASPQRRRNSKQVRSTTRSAFSPSQRQAPSATWSVHVSRCCAHRQHLSPRAEALRHRCCSRRLDGWRRSIRLLPARPIWTHCLRRCSRGDSLDRAGGAEVAQAASAAPPPHAPRGSDFLLDALATLFSDSYEFAVPILRRAQAAFSTDESAIEQLRWLWLATIASVQLWDDTGWRRCRAARAIRPSDRSA